MKKTFLQTVKTAIETHFTDPQNQPLLVFASRRAQVNFEQICPQNTDIKRPATTIDKWLLCQQKELTPAPKFELLLTLHNIYTQHHPGQTLEQFYDFGELLLADFDAIDRYMVGPESLYTVVADTKDIEKKFSQDDPIYQVGSEFWAYFNKENQEKDMDRKFIEIWQSLFKIYTKLKTELTTQNKAYTGMIYRRVAENFDPQNTQQHVVFIGLNALSKSELTVLQKLQTAQKADFIWDYDPQWLDDNFIEAGHFIRKNIKTLPQATYYTDAQLNDPAELSIDIITTPLETMQCKAVHQLLCDQSTHQTTAIILTDENLLFPLLDSLPSGTTAPNVSIGYPVIASKAGVFAELLLELHRTHKKGEGMLRSAIKNLLMHPYIDAPEAIAKIEAEKSLYFSCEYMSETTPSSSYIWEIDTEKSGIWGMHDYLSRTISTTLEACEDTTEKAFLRLVAEAIETITKMLATYTEQLTPKIYTRLLRQSICEKRMDFTGVHGREIQIMGILESRALDFDRVIVLSMGDDNFPSAKPDRSYIPQRLLEGYGMPSQAEKSAIWSYYFYRLLLRCHKAELLYCNTADGLNTGEASRYIQQLRFGGKYTPQIKNLTTPQLKGLNTTTISGKKDHATLEKLKGLKFSPSALGRYLACPMSFYLHYIKEVKSQQNIDQQISPADIGTITHNTLEELYKPLKQPLFAKKISKITPQNIDNQINIQFNETCAAKLDTQSASAQFAISEIKKMVENTIDYDKTNTETTEVYALEGHEEMQIGNYKIGGKVDRVDTLNTGELRIIDYKTGKVEYEFDSIESVFGGGTNSDTTKPRNKKKEAMQLLMYCLMLYKNHSKDTTPLIYAPRELGAGATPQPFILNKAPLIKPLTVAQYTEIEEATTTLLDEIHDRNNDFFQVFDNSPFGGQCQYCDFLPLCSKRS